VGRTARDHAVKPVGLEKIIGDEVFGQAGTLGVNQIESCTGPKTTCCSERLNPALPTEAIGRQLMSFHVTGR
jgi:hypothetical protein